MPTLEVILRWAVGAGSTFRTRFVWSVEQRREFRISFAWRVASDDIWHLGRRVISSEVNDTT